MEEVKVNQYGTNSKIKARILDDETMRKIGFTDYVKDEWYFMKMLDSEISFNVSIKKNDPDNVRIDILDENFGQPYDYQMILEDNPNFEFALKIKDEVERWMSYLQEQGVLSGHVYGEYI